MYTDPFNSAKFAPNNDLGDHYTTSPRLAPRDARTPQRSATVSERIAQRFKEIQRRAVAPSVSAATSDAANETTEENEEESPKVDKGKGKAVEPHSPVLALSPPPMSPPLPPSKAEDVVAPLPPTPILLAGLSLPPSAVSNLLSRAAAELHLRPIRFPLIGEYPECFSGSEFVEWLNKNVHGFGGNIDLAEEGARDLTERDGLLRRVGEFGNQFEHADDAYYQFRPKVRCHIDVFAILLTLDNRHLTLKASHPRFQLLRRRETRLPTIC